MKNRFWINSLTALITMVVASLLNLAVCALAVKILDLFIVVDYFTAAVLKIVMSFIVFGGVIGAVHFYDGYKRVEFLPAHICGSVAVGGVAHLALSVLLVFHPMIAGGTRFLAGILDMGKSFNAEERVDDIYLWTYLISFGMYLAVQIAISVACGYFGKKYRLYNRTQIEGYTDNHDE